MSEFGLSVHNSPDLDCQFGLSILPVLCRNAMDTSSLGDNSIASMSFVDRTEGSGQFEVKEETPTFQLDALLRKLDVSEISAAR